jgi:hypothetical protein
MSARPLLFAAIGVALLGGLFWLLRPASTPALPVLQSAPVAPAQDVATRAAPQFELVVRGRKLVSGPAVLRVQQDDPVIIGVTSDEAEELHLHGYDLKLELEPGVRGTLAFKADRSGRFEYELEHSGTELGALEVLPR